MKKTRLERRAKRERSLALRRSALEELHSFALGKAMKFEAEGGTRSFGKGVASELVVLKRNPVAPVEAVKRFSSTLRSLQKRLAQKRNAAAYMPSLAAELEKRLGELEGSRSKSFFRRSAFKARQRLQAGLSLTHAELFSRAEAVEALGNHARMLANAAALELSKARNPGKEVKEMLEAASAQFHSLADEFHKESKFLYKMGAARLKQGVARKSN